MPSAPLVYLLDGSGGAWLLGATDNGSITTSFVTPAPAGSIASYSLLDQSDTSWWTLTVDMSGDPVLTAGAASPPSAAQLNMVSTGGFVWTIQVYAGQLQTQGPCLYQLTDVLSALAQRLYDPSNQFWTQAELILYVQEAMRTWNALTSFWRDDFTFSTQAGVAWYDLTSSSQLPNTLRPLTLTDTDLYTVMEYHLLEPPVGAGTWTGSLQFSVSDLMQAVNRRRDELLGAAGCRITRMLVPAVPGRVSLPRTVLDIRRVAYFPATGDPSVLWQSDKWGLQSFEPDYATSAGGVPSVWSISTEPWISFDVDIPPAVPGQYELLLIESAGPLTTMAASLLQVPDDWAWVIKWGALADLLSRDSNARDLLRAKYCEERYRDGVELLTAAPAILGLELAGVPLQIDAVKAADMYNTGWQAATPAQPETALVAGLNLIALSPTPDAGPYSLLATVVENAPVPVSPNDCMVIGKDLFDILVDYAQHLAAFKQGGAEFLATIPLHARFLHEAVLYNSRLAERGEFQSILYAQSQRQSSLSPRYTADADPAMQGAD